MTKLLNRTNQLHNSQFGVRLKLVTKDALKSVVVSMRYNLNKLETSAHVIFLDIKKFGHC